MVEYSVNKMECHAKQKNKLLLHRNMDKCHKHNSKVRHPPPQHSHTKEDQHKEKILCNLLCMNFKSRQNRAALTEFREGVTFGGASD